MKNHADVVPAPRVRQFPQAQGAGEGDIVPVVRVVRQFTRARSARDGDGSPEDGSWAVEKLTEGTQAAVFVVRRPDGRCLWQTHLCLVIKLYARTGRPRHWGPSPVR
jgi:hypothetical protein